MLLTPDKRKNNFKKVEKIAKKLLTLWGRGDIIVELPQKTAAQNGH